jgi:predicted nuclease of predicted toxin-antitoxin system
VRFLADENVDRQIVELLRQDGHDVAYVAEMSPGITDETVLRQSRDAASILITADKDFGELVFRQRQTTTGVILVRLFGVAPSTKASLISMVVREHGHELTEAFTVISPGNIRIRRAI